MGRCLCFFLIMLMALFAGMRGKRDKNCSISDPCGRQGLLMKFPFRLKDQTEHCGYPKFVLSCSQDNQTMLELPDSVRLLVKNINYKSKEIMVQDPDRCFARLRNLNLAASPFRFNHGREFTFFNYSSKRSDSSSYFASIPCLSVPGNPVYAVASKTLCSVFGPILLPLASRRFSSLSAPILSWCWRSETFPLCDGSHVKHNKATGDNVGPLLLKK